MRPGERLSLMVTLLNEQCVEVPETVGRWSRGAGGVRSLPLNHQITSITKFSIRRLVHRTAHTPV